MRRIDHSVIDLRFKKHFGTENMFSCSNISFIYDMACTKITYKIIFVFYMQLRNIFKTRFSFTFSG